jgi:hypothetical protein
MRQARRKNQRATRSEGHCFVLDPEDVDDLLALMVRRSGTELLEIKIRGHRSRTRGRNTGRERLFPRFHRMGSIGLSGDSLMLKAG